jgi:hypothetical protein
LALSCIADKCSLRAQHRKSFPSSGTRQAYIETNEVQGRRVVIGRDYGGRKLQAIGGAKRVSAKQAFSGAPYRL